MPGEYVSPFQPKTVVTQAEKDDLLAYARIVANPDGLALSHLRKPGSAQSLQELEVIASALVADGRLTTKFKQGVTVGSGFYLYFVKEGA